LVIVQFFAFLIFLTVSAISSADEKPRFADVIPGLKLEFPRDEGSHPAFRTEWWYVTGWITDEDKHERGFQITFFRARPDKVDAKNPSRFSPQHILFAHVALSDAAEGKLLHAQRTARAGFDLAEAKTGTTQVWIHNWSLRQNGSRYVAKIVAPQFAFEFEFTATQPPMLNGANGYSQKSSNPLAASYYYSIPQLAVSGSLTQRGKQFSINGSAWLDHEWSSEYIDPRAAGWDWTGINFDDGSALMAFRMREPSGKSLWAGGTYRNKDGTTEMLEAADISFAPIKQWRSTKSGASYPIRSVVRAGNRDIELVPLLDDQELDAGDAARAVYWEGAVRALQNGKQIGRGYLELTGYAKPLKF
jgi:predicted secreted hydrolase